MNSLKLMLKSCPQTLNSSSEIDGHQEAFTGRLGLKRRRRGHALSHYSVSAEECWIERSLGESSLCEVEETKASYDSEVIVERLISPGLEVPQSVLHEMLLILNRRTRSMAAACFDELISEAEFVEVRF